MTTALDIIGQTFDHTADGSPTKKGWDELTQALSMYSDKRYETARYLFIKDGKIARHVAVSSRQPSETIARPDDNFLYTIRDYVEDTNSKVVFVHNHPSGHIVPSDADIKLTNMLENVFTDRDGEKRLLGHAIIDHGNFGLYTPQSGWKALIDGNIAEMYEAEQTRDRNAKTGMQIHTDTDLIDIAEFVKKIDAGSSWDRTRWVHSVLTDITGTVTTHELIGIDEFENQDRLIQKLKDIGRRYGSPSIYLFPTNSTQHLICERFAEDTRVVKDIYYENEQGGFELSQFSGGSLFSRITTEDVTVEDTDNLDPTVVQEKINGKKVSDVSSAIMTRRADISKKTRENANNLSIVTDQEFSLFIDNLFDKNYRALPNIIRLPNFDDALSSLLNVKNTMFIFKNDATHTRPDRKNRYNQDLTREEYKKIPFIIRNTKAVLIDKEHHNFMVVFDDKINNQRINSLVFNKDTFGNYLVTASNKDKISFRRQSFDIAGVGIEPTIHGLFPDSPNTTLSASPATSISIPQSPKKSSEKETINANSTANIQEKISHKEVNTMANEKIQMQRDMSRVVVIDTETTGFTPGVDEILQVTAKDGNGNILINEYVKPKHRKSWPGAMKKNHITPEMVSSAPIFDSIRDKLQDIIDNADMLISYNGEFDMKHLEASGINVDKTKPHLDVMKAFTPITGTKKWSALTDACNHYHIALTDAHNSSSDVDGTLAVAKAMYGENLERLSEEDMQNYAVTYDRIKIQNRNEYYRQKYQKNNKIEVIKTSNKNEQNNNVQESVLGAYIYKAHPEAVADFIRNNPDSNITAYIRKRIDDQSIKNTSLINAALGKEFYGDDAMQDESSLFYTYKKHGKGSKEFSRKWEYYVRQYPDTNLTDLLETFSHVANTDRYALEKENFKLYASALTESVAAAQVENVVTEATAIVNNDVHVQYPTIHRCGIGTGNGIDFIGEGRITGFEERPMSFEDTEEISKALQNPVAVYERGNMDKSQDVIVQIVKDNKNCLVPIHYNKDTNKLEISTIREMFGRDNVEWMKWIEQGKMLYGDKEKISEISNAIGSNISSREDTYYKSSAYIALQNMGNDNEVFTENYPQYTENKERAAIAKKFRTAYQDADSINASEAPMQAKEFYDALKNNNTDVIDKYVNRNTEISSVAKQIAEEWQEHHVYTPEESIDISTTEPKNGSVRENKTPSFLYKDGGKENNLSANEAQEARIAMLERTVNELQNQYRQEREEWYREREILKGRPQEIQQPAETKETGAPMPVQEADKPRYSGGGGIYTFSKETAFRKGTVIPDYGSYNAETQRIELVQGFRFEEAQSIALNPDGSIIRDKEGKPIYGKARDADPNKVIILSKIDENGKRIEQRMPEQSYLKIIKTQERFEKMKENTAENTLEWKALHDDYARKMGVDLDELRLNTWENFLHNYQIYCKRYANNESQAYKQAARLVHDMLPEQRAYFNEQRRRYGAEEFDKRLHDAYVKIKDEEVAEDFYFAPDNPNAQAEEPIVVTKHDNELLAGTPIAGTTVKVGDTIPMAFRIKGLYGEREELNPVSDYKITKISKGFKPERAILYSATARSAYCVYLPDLVTYLKKYERQKGIASIADKYAYEFVEGKPKPKIKEKRPSWFDRHKSEKAKIRTENARKTFNSSDYDVYRG